MKTERLIELLARDAGPAPRAVAAKRLASAVALGLVASAGLSIAWLGMIPRTLFATPVPWSKMVYAGALIAAAVWWVARLSRPAASPIAARRAVVAVLLAMAALGIVSCLSEPPGQRLAALMGASWLVCPVRVMVLSVPALVASLWAVGGLAPTRPRVTGFAAGLLAGAIGGFAYALSCPEPSPAFVAAWYTLGMLLAGAVGTALGPRVLRW